MHDCSCPASDEPIDAVMRLGYEPGHGLTVRITEPPAEPMQPLDDYTRKRIQTRRRGLVHPYELAPMLAGPGGSFVEHDIDDQGRLVPVERTPGQNRAGVVVGVVTTPRDAYPEGITRVAVLGDPTRAMGAIAEAECVRIIAAIDLASAMDVPIEWFALSAGAKIAMDSGSENLDWVARVLRRLVEHTQARWRGQHRRRRDQRRRPALLERRVDDVDAHERHSRDDPRERHGAHWQAGDRLLGRCLGGGQPGHRRLRQDHGAERRGAVLRPDGRRRRRTSSSSITASRTGRRASAGRGGSPPPIHPIATCGLTRTSRRAASSQRVGEIFSESANRDRKKPFDIRTVIDAVVDADHEVLERWPEMAEAEMAVVCDARLGGLAVTIIGIESRPLPRHGLTPADGPGQWSAGTLFPLSSKKVARAINAANGRRPVVMLANLSGFDGSPESLRRLQLEYGAEIGRALVNFDGPFVLCVISRYHGGAFVVFSAKLNDDIEVLAVEGSYASVIGGAPAAAVVFTREVDERTRADARVQDLERALAAAPEEEADLRRADLATTIDAVRTEKLGEVAARVRCHPQRRARQGCRFGPPDHHCRRPPS